MPGPKAETIELTETQETILEQFVRREKSCQQLVRRSQIILAANAGVPTEQIAQRLGLTCNTVRTWRNRWSEAAEDLLACEGEEKEKEYRHRIVNLLSDSPRSGTPPTFSAEQICQIVALACEHPSQSGRPITHWTPRELADESMKRGIVYSISSRHVGRFLKSVRP
jgi:putative transposase